jgi:ribosomal protein S4E
VSILIGVKAMMTPSRKLRDGEYCVVGGGTHAGKSGTLKDIKTSKTGHIAITIQQKNGERFKTLARNIVVQTDSNAWARR